MLRILVADDHEIVRRGLVALLKSRPGWEVCGEAADGRQAVEKTKELKPDIVILDIGMPSLNGFEATRQIVRDSPRSKVLILTVTEADEVARAVLDAGARGFIFKSDAARDLVTAVEALECGRTFFTSRIAEMVLGGYFAGQGGGSVKNRPILTHRECEITQLLAEGKSTKEVAALLGLSVKTAETHRSNIMRKLDLHSVAELVLYAVRNNFVQAGNTQMPAQPPR